MLNQDYNIPITHAALSNNLKEYARPNDKISYLMEQGDLIYLAKGKYVSKYAFNGNIYIRHQSANILYGPSYISRYSALSFYGLLYESTTVVESMTLKRSTTFENELGTFNFYSQPVQTVFATGIESKLVITNGSILIASPAKAICDIIWTTPNLILKTVDDIAYFLEEDIRMEIEILKEANLEQIEYCAQFGKKRKEINLFLSLIKKIK